MNRYILRHIYLQRHGEHSRGMGRHRGHHRGHGFGHGRLHLAVLQQIAVTPCHGYELIRSIEQRTGGRYAPSPGVLYPTLTHLVELGYIEAESEAGERKRYRITVAGREYLDANRALLEAMDLAVRQAEPVGTGEDPRLRRALQNLHTALDLRLERGPLPDAACDAIAAALDAAAHRIERT
jgi:DNA-binding PadR family transcriptional regulator